MSTQQDLVVAELEVKRAKDALASERRENDKKALREAIARGRALRAEYERVLGQFQSARDEASRLQALLENLNQDEAALRASEPYVNDVLASEPEQAEWEKDCERVRRKRSAVIEEHTTVTQLRDSSQMEAIKAGRALDHQTQVVRNLKQKLEDPNGEYMRRGWEGGVFVPLGGRANL
jgi:chromosome segregation ATPase